MPLRAPRLLLVAAAFVAAAALPASSPIPTSATDLTVGQAESRMVGLINADRAKAGLVALRTDGRLMSIARARSQDMATYHYFSHTEPDGQTAQSYLTAAGVVWDGWVLLVSACAQGRQRGVERHRVGDDGHVDLSLPGPRSSLQLSRPGARPGRQLRRLVGPDLVLDLTRGPVCSSDGDRLPEGPDERAVSDRSWEDDAASVAEPAMCLERL